MRTALLAGLVVATSARVVSGQGVPATRPAVANKADVEFMQGMIAHHGQAVTMAALVPGHTARDAMHLLAQRIDVSQRDEIKMMQTWLTDRGQPAPSMEAGHEHHEGMAEPMRMPGMLTPEELAQLGAAKGTEFDRLFLTYMIRHHEGALTMVAKLFATNGAAQDAQIFEFATDVDADQRAEIARMQALLATLPAR